VRKVVAKIKEAQRICPEANIRLHKFVSNDKELIKHVFQLELFKAAQNLNITKEVMSCQ